MRARSAGSPGRQLDVGRSIVRRALLIFADATSRSSTCVPRILADTKRMHRAAGARERRWPPLAEGTLDARPATPGQSKISLRADVQPISISPLRGAEWRLRRDSTAPAETGWRSIKTI